MENWVEIHQRGQGLAELDDLARRKAVVRDQSKKALWNGAIGITFVALGFAFGLHIMLSFFIPLALLMGAGVHANRVRKAIKGSN